MAKRYFENNKHKPGVISDDLKRALGLHSDKLPIWIYRMRVLGYPPGWLAQAKVKTLAIFDGLGEDGELNDTTEEVQEYNKESLIEFPGFNCPPPPGIRDDWYYLRMPPMLPTQQLNEALKTMKVSEPVPYKKAKLDLPSSSTSTPQSSKSVPDFKSPDTPESRNSPMASPASTTNGNASHSNVSIDSIGDDSKILETSLDESESANESINSERKLKMISMGSPMPVSEHTNRPPLEKWAVGMGELLYFENPSTEYTGVYHKKMKGLIDKIRDKQKT